MITFNADLGIAFILYICANFLILFSTLKEIEF